MFGGYQSHIKGVVHFCSFQTFMTSLFKNQVFHQLLKMLLPVYPLHPHRALFLHFDFLNHILNAPTTPFMRSSENGFENKNLNMRLGENTERSFDGNISKLGKNRGRIQLTRRKVTKVKFKPK